MSEPLEITVRGYSERYRAAVDREIGIEGGLSDDPVDRGGTTQYGVSLRFLVAEGKIDLDHDGLADFDLDMDGDIDGRDIRLLTKGDAVWIYSAFFWKPLRCEEWDKPLGEMLFDQGINGGLVAAKKLFQRAINACNAHVSDAPRLAVDGLLGSRTVLAEHEVLEHPGLGIQALAEAYREEARKRYRAIAAADPSQRRFLKGWLARADALGRDA